MDFSKRTKSDLPEGGTLKTRFSIDGDVIPESVTYDTASGQKKTVKMVMTPDGDYIPETGYTMDGDFNWPDKKWTF